MAKTFIDGSLGVSVIEEMTTTWEDNGVLIEDFKIDPESGDAECDLTFVGNETVTASELADRFYRSNEANEDNRIRVESVAGGLKVLKA